MIAFPGLLWYRDDGGRSLLIVLLHKVFRPSHISSNLTLYGASITQQNATFTWKEKLRYYIASFSMEN